MARFVALIPLLLTFSWANPLHPKGMFALSTGRIVGGIETTIEQFPFQASFQIYGYHRCGAVIIRQDVALTAGHCTDGQDPWTLSVKAGIEHWDDEGTYRQVERYISHENYSMATLESDLSILFLEKGFDFRSSVQPIKLASAGEELAISTKALVSGWGTMDEYGTVLSDELRYAAVSIWDQKKCERAYDGINAVSSKMFCAGEPHGGVDPCQGDSGGPLIVGNKLFGTVSWGLGCARVGYPSVYVKIGAMRGWIDDKIKQNLK